MQILKRAIKPQDCISFLHIYSTTWGTAGDICLIRESVAETGLCKFIGHKVRLVLPKGMERHYLGGLPVIKVAGHVGDGHPKDKNSLWEIYEGVSREVAIAAIKPWGFKLVDIDAEMYHN
ncbi:hypothetical protein H6F32_03760 [Anabaena sp. FACHB-1237]|uniref:hypothetical protein n=1 Tax=Anabaena sp. FACHB-1237 TaxID=2692769 RepID=UPI001681C05A|nr:hypothetical protein [Anabaena sp. FACHB-1237]MBD2136723.1 hypothetical protein [Anabaena sp. FACHB-1237]